MRLNWSSRPAIGKSAGMPKLTSAAADRQNVRYAPEPEVLSDWPESQEDHSWNRRDDSSAHGAHGDLGNHGSDTSDQFALDPDTVPSVLEWGASEPEPVNALIIDPDREARFYLRAKLAMAGMMRADEAATGSDALYLLKTRRYHLVLMDVDLPDMDGWQLTRRVTASKHQPALADFVVLTRQHFSWLGRLRARLAGAHSCLAKPLEPAELALLLQRLGP